MPTADAVRAQEDEEGQEVVVEVEEGTPRLCAVDAETRAERAAEVREASVVRGEVPGALPYWAARTAGSWHSAAVPD